MKSRKLIEQLFKEGKNFSVFPFRVYYLIMPNAERQKPNAEVPTANCQLPALNSQLSAGVGASSKNFKKAVDRNRIKRLTRESYRLQKNELQNLLKERNQQLAIFFIYTSKDLPEYKMVFEKMGLILQRLIKIISENNLANT